mmetsp:Transcript_11239/g.38313  ORF Transcript_11239/g.38313 Transcript_11239/m.38313 type:complete len:236 (-) Transcript_11239:1061-1768(-)
MWPVASAGRLARAASSFRAVCGSPEPDIVHQRVMGGQAAGHGLCASTHLAGARAAQSPAHRPVGPVDGKGKGAVRVLRDPPPDHGGSHARAPLRMRHKEMVELGEHVLRARAASVEEVAHRLARGPAPGEVREEGRLDGPREREGPDARVLGAKGPVETLQVGVAVARAPVKAQVQAARAGLAVHLSVHRGGLGEEPGEGAVFGRESAGDRRRAVGSRAQGGGGSPNGRSARRAL